MAASPLLHLDRLRKSFGSNCAVDDLSFSVEDGEIVGIIGPNGAGKTTLFNLIAGALTPDEGGVLLDGRAVTGLSSHRRCRKGIARSFQIPQSFSQMSVYENVLVGAEFGARGRAISAEEIAAQTLRKMELLPQCDALAGSLRLLDQKRLGLARAVATKPRLLLLDEVAGGLTDDEKQDLLALIANLNDDGLTVLWIEHAVDALAASVERLIAINYGTLVADDTPEAVLSDTDVQEIYLGMEEGHA